MDDEVLARRSLSSLLNLEPDFEIVGECDAGDGALRAIEDTLLDLVFLDIQMPGLDGFAVLEGTRPERMPIGT